MSFEVKLDAFAGPLQLLLELIEKEDVAITEVSLAAITEEYLRYLETHDVPSSELADFLVVAAKLIYLKSRAILPQIAPEEEGADALAAQLKLYKEFVDATVYVDQLVKNGCVAFARPKASAPVQSPIVKFSAPENLTNQSLASAFEHLLKRLEPFFTLQQTSMQKVASVQERIRQIHDVLLTRAQMTFSDVTKGAASRVDVLVSFLALLELMKQRIVHAVQTSAFGEIALNRIDGEAVKEVEG